MDYLSYWIYVPIVIAIILVVAIITISQRKQVKAGIFKEIKRNKKYIETMAQVLVDNRAFFKGDKIKAFEHSKGFLLKSAKDMEDEEYLRGRSYFKDYNESITLESAYKAFAVVTDVLSYLDKINSEVEINTFLTNFHTAGNTALRMANKALTLEEKD